MYGHGTYIPYVRTESVTSVIVQAMHTGHDGSMSTLHANGPDEALWRLESLAMSVATGISTATLRLQIRSAIHRVVSVERKGGVRRVTSIHSVGAETLTELYRC